MRVLVSGATGFVGRFIVEHLAEAGETVIAGCRRAPAAGFFSHPLKRVLSISIRRSINLPSSRISMSSFMRPSSTCRGAIGAGRGTIRRGFGSQCGRFDPPVRIGAGRRRFAMPVSLEPRRLWPPTARRGDDGGDAGRSGQSLRDRQARGRAGACGARQRGFCDGQPAGDRRLWGRRAGKRQQMDAASGRLSNGGAGCGPDRNGGAWRRSCRCHSLPDPGACGQDARRLQCFGYSDRLSDVLSIAADALGTGHALPEAADRSQFNAMETARLRALGWQPGGRAKFEETVRRMAAAHRV